MDKCKIDKLHEILKWNNDLYAVIQNISKLNIEKYYIGAGCITQTVWNYYSNNEPMYGVGDIDFVYFDNDISEHAEKEMEKRIEKIFGNFPIKFDVKNEARVHLWYKEKFGYNIKPYTSLEKAIDTWPTTATAIGVRLIDDDLEVYAPFLLDDLFSNTVRGNKIQITKEIYYTKANKWKEKWPNLNIIPW